MLELLGNSKSISNKVAKFFEAKIQDLVAKSNVRGQDKTGTKTEATWVEFDENNVKKAMESCKNKKALDSMKFPC